jgi:hypothetical protein
MVGHLDHICEVLSLQPGDFEVTKMWRRPISVPMAVMKKGDLSLFLVTHMDSVDPNAWEKTLVRHWGTSPFTGEDNWADGSHYVSEPLSVLDYG